MVETRNVLRSWVRGWMGTPLGSAGYRCAAGETVNAGCLNQPIYRFESCAAHHPILTGAARRG